jgi:hypothetical protein
LKCKYLFEKIILPLVVDNTYCAEFGSIFAAKGSTVPCLVGGVHDRNVSLVAESQDVENLFIAPVRQRVLDYIYGH